MRVNKPRHARPSHLPRHWILWGGAVLCLALAFLLWPKSSLTATSQETGDVTPHLVVSSGGGSLGSSQSSPTGDTSGGTTPGVSSGGGSGASTQTGEGSEGNASDFQGSPSGGSAGRGTGEDSPWYLRLVNRDHPLPQDFSVEVVDVQEGQFDSRAADALKQMLEAMESQGLSPLICSSFRRWEDQETLHQEEVEAYLNQGLSQEKAEQEASRWVVPAGQSEHELGLAADIVAQGYQVLEEEQEDTPEQQWLMAHCWEYGFILRYPKDKESLTGVGYEPWHYRYVGKEAAQKITEQGLCLEEYLQ